MRITRRQFIKLGAGGMAAGVFLPRGFYASESAIQDATSRRVLVIIQFAGGNDGLNMVVPFSDSRYRSLRPTISFTEQTLVDSQGRSTILTDKLGLHPSLAEIKALYDERKVAITLGVGYPNPSLSHFLSTDIWHTADTTGLLGTGWLGKFADITLSGIQGLPGISVGSSLPKSLYSSKVTVPSISSFSSYDLFTDSKYTRDRNNQLTAFRANNNRASAEDGFLKSIAQTGTDALKGVERLKAAIATYTSPVVYPTNNSLASGLKMLAQVITTVPESQLLYVTLGGFDTHSNERTAHTTLFGYFSAAVDAFYRDMQAHSLADNVVIMQWSEFGRRPNENASAGTDHGTAAPMLIIGNMVRGGLYGEQPSLATTALDNAGNMKFTVDFRQVYATILNYWLGIEANQVLGGNYTNLGFLA
jgi:uncharacterized protein (DUF1501 family)